MEIQKIEFHSTTKIQEIRLAEYLKTFTIESFQDHIKRDELLSRLNAFMSKIEVGSEPYIQAYDCVYAIEQYNFKTITIDELHQRINTLKDMLCPAIGKDIIHYR